MRLLAWFWMRSGWVFFFFFFYWLLVCSVCGFVGLFVLAVISLSLVWMGGDEVEQQTGLNWNLLYRTRYIAQIGDGILRVLSITLGRLMRLQHCGLVVI
jgi:hypothetical protein